MSNNASELGRVIKRRRLIAGLTLSELGTRSGVSASYLGRIERGERFPSARILRQIANPLGFDEVELFYFVARLLASELVVADRTAAGIIAVLKEISRKKQ